MYYNRFRYYAPEEGVYLSQDPIGLMGGMELYSYVKDVNSEVDVLGLNPIIVIGENQAAVNAAARKLSTSGYNVESMQFPKSQWKFTKPLDSPKNVSDAVEWNKRWMIDKLNQGYDVVDIGFDSHRDVSARGRSPFYAKELEALSETRSSGKRIQLKIFPDGESVKDMRARLHNGCH